MYEKLLIELDLLQFVSLIQLKFYFYKAILFPVVQSKTQER
jgi:hypothetical protein